MTAAGWIFMLLSWSLIIGLFAYCMVRIIRSDKNQKDRRHES